MPAAAAEAAGDRFFKQHVQTCVHNYLTSVEQAPGGEGKGAFSVDAAKPLSAKVETTCGELPRSRRRVWPASSSFLPAGLPGRPPGDALSPPLPSLSALSRAPASGPHVSSRRDWQEARDPAPFERPGCAQRRQPRPTLLQEGREGGQGPSSWRGSWSSGRKWVRGAPRTLRGPGPAGTEGAGGRRLCPASCPYTSVWPWPCAAGPLPAPFSPRGPRSLPGGRPRTPDSVTVARTTPSFTHLHPHATNTPQPGARGRFHVRRARAPPARPGRWREGAVDTEYPGLRQSLQGPRPMTPARALRPLSPGACGSAHLGSGHSGGSWGAERFSGVHGIRGAAREPTGWGARAGRRRRHAAWFCASSGPRRSRAGVLGVLGWGGGEGATTPAPEAGGSCDPGLTPRHRPGALRRQSPAGVVAQGADTPALPVPPQLQPEAPGDPTPA